MRSIVRSKNERWPRLIWPTHPYNKKICHPDGRHNVRPCLAIVCLDWPWH